MCELFTTLPRPQSWAVKLEECGTGNPDRTRKKEVAKSLAATPSPTPRSRLLREPSGPGEFGAR